MNVNFLKVKDYKGEVVVCAQHKLDGHYVQFERRDIIVAKTRTEGVDIWDKLAYLPHIADLVLDLPKQTIICGELHCPGVQATSVKTLINERSNELRFTAFAIPWHNDNDFRSACILKEANLLLATYGFTLPRTIWYESPKRLDHIQIEALMIDSRQLDIEGYVVKEAHYRGWYKIKPVRTIDCVVIHATKSFAETTAGGLRGIGVGVWDGEKLIELSHVGSGFTMDFRMTVDRKTLHGRVAEIAYDSVTDTKSLRFPRFLRWRDDKKGSECTIDQMV